MPWSDQFLSKRGIRDLCRKKLLDEILEPMKSDDEWKVLIVDEFGMKILSACFETEEVMAYNIALIENLGNTNEPLPYLSAIYILCPSEQNIGCLQTDFVSATPKYQSVHLFFLSAVRDECFKELVKYTCPGLVQTFTEIDLLFLPYESQVFSLDDDKFFSVFFDCYKELDVNYCTIIAKKLATLCFTLKACPRIRYRRSFVKNFVLAEAVQQQLSSYWENLQLSDTDSETRPRCELLILDRGFDCISPVVHEFTLQAMAFDLLNIEDDIYVYTEKLGDNEDVINEIPLSETDSLWRRLRHEHIANVAKVIENIQETSALMKRCKKLSEVTKLPDLGDAVRKHLAYRQNEPHVIYRRIANECMKLYCSGINVLTETEQNLVSCAKTEKSTIKDLKSSLFNILGNESYSINDKLRVLLLYAFSTRGLSKQDFSDILKRCELPFYEAWLITNVIHLDIDVLRPRLCKPADFIEKEMEEIPYYKQSQWVPVIKNVMLSCIDGTLSSEKYPYLDIKQNELISSSKRAGYWCTDKKDKHVCRLIIFIAGGLTYSEMRSAYEVMEKYKGWEVLIGGDSILTPQKFMNKLKELRTFFHK